MASHVDILERRAAAFLRPGADRRACRLMNRPASDGGPLTLVKLAGELGIEPSERTARLQRARDLAARAYDEALRRGITLLTTNDERYPARLLQIPDPPIALWTFGPASLDEPAVAIVGSRTATPAGLIVARQLGTDLAARGYTVVSGMAASVDGAAHQAALAAGGATVAVLGWGVDVVYPERHRALGWVDAWAFERLLEEAESERKKGAAGKAVQYIERAASLYKGPFLAGEIDEPWLISPRERLKSKFVRSLTWLGSHWQKSKEWEKAIESYLRGLEIDDLAGELYRELMACYQHLGRRAEALSIYQRCRKTLAANLGIEPSPRTQEIYRSIMANGKREGGGIRKG